MAEVKMVKGRTYYSEDCEGNRRNYGWPVRYDVTDGYIGVTQMDGNKVKDRVLLSPKQVKKLVEFIGRYGL